jgi:sucrose-6-phosphate hydrolase SacC (GH32 family)
VIQAMLSACAVFRRPVARAVLACACARLEMHLYVDASSVEVFLNDGETVMKLTSGET